ncbi:hypothetical protein KA005_33555, partial [bacterium]|nr:hypothetical protein [bacterium]
IRSTYYFRAKPHVFNPRIITKISKLGHEIGYHYESLSDTDGDIDLALKDFEKKLKRFREIVTVKTISMHGRPLKPFDNRDIWRTPENHQLLFDKYGILGEVYLDIDYKDIAYINDTGRNWFSNKSNIRDQVESNVRQDFDKGEELYNYLASNPDPRVVFQVHPERWSDHITGYYVSLLVDLIVNVGKHVVKSIGERR